MNIICTHSSCKETSLSGGLMLVNLKLRQVLLPSPAQLWNSSCHGGFSAAPFVLFTITGFQWILPAPGEQKGLYASICGQFSCNNYRHFVLFTITEFQRMLPAPGRHKGLSQAFANNLVVIIIESFHTQFATA